MAWLCINVIFGQRHKRRRISPRYQPKIAPVLKPPVKKNNSQCSACGTKVPAFFKFICNQSKKDTISFNEFKNAALYYSKHVKSDDTSPYALKKAFLLGMLLFGKNGKLSKSKILNFDYVSHYAYAKELNILKYGQPPPRPPGSGSQCGGCTCPSDFSQSGCACACSWGICCGWCNGNSCDYSDLPFICV